MHKRYWRGDIESSGTVPCTMFGYFCGKETISTVMTCDDILQIPNLKTYCEDQFNAISDDLDTEMKLQGTEIKSCPGVLTGGHNQD